MNNITKAVFNNTRSIVTPFLWQYDYGQILQIEGIELPETYEVHFSNQAEAGTATTSLGSSAGVEIPDVYLQTGKPVYAFIYLHEGEDDGETEYKITIPVKARPQVSNVAPTPVQQDVITQTIAALNEAVAAAQAVLGALEDMAADATTLQPGSSASVTKETDPETGAVTLHFGIPRGDTGAQGIQGPRGETGATGATGAGVAAGGAAGQVLKKKSGTDYDTEWTDLKLEDNIIVFP